MANRQAQAASKRQLQVGEQIRKILYQTLHKKNILYPAVNTNITLTQVSLSPDFKNALVYVFISEENVAGRILDTLQKNAAFFRWCIAKNLPLRSHPRLCFSLDARPLYARHIDNILQTERVRRDLETPHQGASDSNDVVNQ